MRLSRHGEAVAYHLEPAGSRFARGSMLYFVSEGAASNPYGDEAVYELELGARARMMPVEGAEPQGAPTEFYWHREEREENRTYQAWQLEAVSIAVASSVLM